MKDVSGFEGSLQPLGASTTLTPTVGICRAVAPNPSDDCSDLTALPALWRDAHVQIAVGTDAGVPGLDWSIEDYPAELEALETLGFTPAEVLHLATASSAFALTRANGERHSELAGSLEVGKHADLVLVTGDPTVTLSDIREVTHVWVRGALAYQR